MHQAATLSKAYDEKIKDGSLDVFCDYKRKMEMKDLIIRKMKFTR